MDPTVAAFLGISLTFVVCALFAFWYVVPWLRAQGRAAALMPLLWIHTARHVALQIYSSQRAGLVVPDQLRDEIAYGDVAGMLLALGALVALRAQSRFAVPLVWLFAAETTADLLGSMIGGMRAGMIATAHNVTWLILVFYVPMLWTTLVLIVWQLIERRGESLGSA